jgi:TonB family protein
LDRVPETVHLVGEGVTSPKVLKRSDPQFSEEATLKHIEGKVLLTVVVGEDGKTRDIQVERGPGYGLDEASVEAIQKWTFEPGKVDGVASAVALSVETSFRVSLRTPKVVRRVDPEFARPGAYPRVKGKILVTLTVDENGLPTNIKVEHSAGKHIDEEAIEAVRQWRFEPGTKDGVAVPMPYDIEFLRF